ncbi:hypothetical protein GCM10010401_17910 [Rarobacter faecitabidus]|uniref:FtsK/SpoIIIE family protein n=1 Tax=Rarobacter faecitabidus TaxID=13243 RepID=A0A542ZUI5_RARFA|nr:hypothetical protein [Rarobacter faecitabidus]TQL64002.1 hypothetical protein FB461_0486 [Rarobacter faecitabidus]
MGIFSRTKQFSLESEVVNGINAVVPRPEHAHALGERHHFPLGRSAGGEVIWDAQARPNLFAVGAARLGRSTLARTLAAHGYEHADAWEIRVVHSALAADSADRTTDYEAEYQARVQTYKDNQGFIRVLDGLRAIISERHAQLATPGAPPLFPILVICDDLELFIHPDFSVQGQESQMIAELLYQLVPRANAAHIHFAVLNKGGSLDRIIGTQLAATFMPITLAQTGEKDSQTLFGSYIASRIPTRNYFRDRDKTLPPLIGRGVTLDGSGEPVETQFYNTVVADTWA